jgi:hypothetical protein
VSATSTAELVVALVPARPGSAWWHEYVARGEVEFLRGRLRFGGAASSAPFPSAVVVFCNTNGVTNLAGAEGSVAESPTLPTPREAP